MLTFAPAAAQAATVASAHHPHIQEFTVHSAALGEVGGKVTLAVAATHASTCTVTAKPALAGLPWHVHCTSHSRTRKITVPPNHAPAAVVYHVHLSAHGPHGTTTRTITLTVHAHKSEEKGKGEEKPTTVVGEWTLKTYYQKKLAFEDPAIFEAGGKCFFDTTPDGEWTYDAGTETLEFQREVPGGAVEKLVGKGPPSGPIDGTWSVPADSVAGEFILERVPG